MQFPFSRLSRILIHLGFSLLFLYATYFLILGGTALYLGIVSDLWLMYSFAQSCTYLKLRYALFALISGLSFFALRSHPMLMWVLLLHALILFHFIGRQKTITSYHRYTTGLFLLGLLTLGYCEHHAIQQLKQHYASFNTGETWQKFGAL